MYYWFKGEGKLSGDLSISYIATYSHEAILTMVLYMAIPAAFYFLVASGKRGAFTRAISFIYLIALLVGAYIANYRTIIIGIIFYMIIVVVTYLYKRKSFILTFNTTMVALIAGVVSASLISVDLSSVIDRFYDIYKLVSDAGRFIKPPEEYSKDEIMVMSGRPYLISVYLSYYFTSPFEVILAGIGSGVGEKLFGAYAHNGYVAALVELGLIGFFAFMYLVFIITSISLRTFKYENGYIFGAFPLSILVIALGTMPFVNVIDLLAFGTYLGICCFLVYFQKQPPSQKQFKGIKSNRITLNANAAITIPKIMPFH
jgi:hypothetical protein